MTHIPEFCRRILRAQCLHALVRPEALRLKAPWPAAAHIYKHGRHGISGSRTSRTKNITSNDWPFEIVHLRVSFTFFNERFNNKTMHADKSAKSRVSVDRSRTSLALAALGLSQLQKHRLQYKNILLYKKQTTTQTRIIRKSTYYYTRSNYYGKKIINLPIHSCC